MSDTQGLKARLFKLPLFKMMTLQTDDGPVELAIRRPAQGRVAEVYDKAEADGLTVSGAGAAKSAEMLARVAALCIYAPGETTPLLTAEEALLLPHLEAVGRECMAALGSPELAIKAAQGN